MSNNPNHDVVCRECMHVTDALHFALRGEPIPACEHQQAAASAPAPIALNNDKALANQLGMTLRKGDL